MIDHLFQDHHIAGNDSHSETSFQVDPTANEHVIFLPGGKVMVVDWGIQSFAKNVVSFTIAGVVAAGAGIAALMWADNRMKKNANSVNVQKSAPVAESEHDDESDGPSEGESPSDKGE